MRNKKAFTVVELVIVIAIIAILAAVLIPTFANIIKKANVSKDQQLIRNLNTALASDRAENGGKNHRNMTEALAAAEKFGYEVSKINASGTDNEILWDSKNDLFCYFDGNDIKYIPESVLAVPVSTDAAYEAGKVNDVDYWVIRNVTDTTATGENKGQISAKYSTYLAGLTGTDATLVVTKGIDVGTNVVASVKYENTTAQEATIVTNGEPLEINAPNDNINHFGEAESVNIIDVKSDSSYHEFGTVPFIQIKSGRLVLEDTADVNGIHLVKTENGSNVSFDDIVLNFGGKTVKLTRDPIGTALGDTLMLVCKVESEGGDEYIWLKGNGTFDSENVYVSSTPNASDATKISEGSASYAAKAVANYLDGSSNPVDSGKDVAAAKAASALKGSGTAEDPFLIYDYATMQKISDFYDSGYCYFEVALDKTDNGTIDLHNSKYISLNGSFDGKNVVFTHVNGGMFGGVGTYDPSDSRPVVLKNFTVQNEGGWGIVQECGATTLEFNNINVTGYSLHDWNAGEFLRYGSGEGFNYTVNFVKCSCNAEIYSSKNAWSTILVGHTYPGGSAIATINVDAYTDEHINDSVLYFTGTGTSEGHKYYGMGGVQVYVDGVAKGSADNKVDVNKIVRVDATKNPSKAEDGHYSITTQADTKKIVVTLLWQYTEWEENYSAKIPDRNGVGGTIGKTLTFEVTGSADVNIFNAITSVEIRTSSDKWDYEIKDGKLILYMTNTNTFIDGNLTLFVEQFTSGGNIAKYKGSMNIATKTTSSEWVIK